MTSFTHNVWVFASSFFEISSDSSYVNARVPTNSRAALKYFLFCLYYLQYEWRYCIGYTSTSQSQSKIVEILIILLEKIAQKVHVNQWLYS